MCGLLCWLTASSASDVHSKPIAGIPDGKTCFVTGFDTRIGEHAVRKRLTEAFSEFGDVERIRLPLNHEDGSPRGFAFVVFADAAGGAPVRCLMTHQ